MKLNFLLFPVSWLFLCSSATVSPTSVSPSSLRLFIVVRWNEKVDDDDFKIPQFPIKYFTTLFLYKILLLLNDWQRNYYLTAIYSSWHFCWRGKWKIMNGWQVCTLDINGSGLYLLYLFSLNRSFTDLCQERKYDLIWSVFEFVINLPP